MPGLIILIALCGFTGIQNASAHAALESSSPISGEVLSTAPTEISVGFTERLDRSYSRLELYDQYGVLVEGTELVDDADDYSMLLRLPTGLANGTYSILWRTLSRDDGHTAQNYFAFTIGSDADIGTVVPPSSSLDTGDAPQWAKALSRWIALIGLAALIAIWPIWNLVIRPALRPIWQVAPVALPRYSALSLMCWGVLGLTGIYAGWLQVGNLNALRTTDYGRALIVKLVFLAVVLVLASINLLIVNRRIASGAERIWHQRLTWLVSAEVMLVLLALLAVGQLTSLQPARDQVIEDAQQLDVPFDLDGRSARLLIAPGTIGANHIRLEVSGERIPTSTVMLLRVTVPERTDLGTQEITLSRVAGNGFEHHGSELSIVGNWRFTLIDRVSGAAPNEATAMVPIGTTRSSSDVPDNPWRFETLGGATGLVLLVVGIAGLVLAWFAGNTRARKENGGLALAAIALGVILLLQARIDPLLVDARGDTAMDTSDLAAIKRGEGLYQNSCMSCHGTDLRGNGPDGIGLDPPPADFSADHALVHSDADLIYWTKNGKQGTAMPGFANTLSDQDVLDVLTFIKSRQEIGSSAVTKPNPNNCSVEPLSIETLVTRSSGPIMPVSDPVVAADPAVASDVESAVLRVVEQFVSCTNAADTMRRLALFSDRQLTASFPEGIDPQFEAAAIVAPLPLAEDRWISIAATPIVSRLTEGRVMVTTALHDPATLSGSTITLILIQTGGDWLIDEIR